MSPTTPAPAAAALSPIVTVELTEAVFQRAIEVQGLLALRGRHRVPIPDLIIAAAAEHTGMVLLHYDADFDRIRGGHGAGDGVGGAA